MNADTAKMAGYRIFEGFDESEIAALFPGGPKTVFYRRGEVILSEGEECRRIGIIVSGICAGEIYSEDGRRDIVATITVGNVFGDVLAMSEGETSYVTVTAATDTSVVYLPYEKLFTGECRQSGRLMKNLAAVISESYFKLMFRLNCVTRPTLRAKILFYLHGIGARAGSSEFVIPLDREELADFLAADRSALSRELSRLRAEGRIDFEKNRFILK